MKRFFIFISVCIFAISAFAGFNTINYQAIVNNDEGSPMVSKSIGIQFRILSGTEVLYTETATVVTSDLGVLNYEIGSSENSNLSDINWSKDLTLEVSLDLKGGSDYSSPVVSSIAAVPTAMMAKTSLDAQEHEYMIRELKAEIDYMNEHIVYLEMVSQDLMDRNSYLDMVSQELMDRNNYLENEIKEMENVIREMENLLEELVYRVEYLQNQVEELQNK